MRYSDTIANDIAPIFIQTIFLSIHVNQYSPTKKTGLFITNYEM